LRYYHWGAPKSTADKFSGADMRGEVIFLSRNIKILGEDIDSWGGHFLTGDTVDFSGGKMKTRIGSTYMDWVEMRNLSQADSERAAMRWEYAYEGKSEITNCAIHNGYGWAMKIENSRNILIKGNNIYNFRPIGIMISNVKDVTVDGNVVAHITKRGSLDPSIDV